LVWGVFGVAIREIVSLSEIDFFVIDSSPSSKLVWARYVLKVVIIFLLLTKAVLQDV